MKIDERRQIRGNPLMLGAWRWGHIQLPIDDLVALSVVG
jgi:hypothetical protein